MEFLGKIKFVFCFWEKKFQMEKKFVKKMFLKKREKWKTFFIFECYKKHFLKEILYSLFYSKIYYNFYYKNMTNNMIIFCLGTVPPRAFGFVL